MADCAERTEEISAEAEVEPLEHLEQLEKTPFGAVWLRADVPSIEDETIDGIVAPLPPLVPPVKRALIWPPHEADSRRTRRAGLGLVLSRFVAVMLQVLWGTLSRRATKVRIRDGLDRLGPTAVKAGQLVAALGDVLSSEVSDELAKSVDEAPPLALGVVLHAIREQTGKPIDRAFAVFDPIPVLSTAVVCVYQVVLRDGTRAALRIRRPDVEAMLRADLEVLLLLLRMTGRLREQGIDAVELRARLETKLVRELGASYSVAPIPAAREA